MTMGPGGYYVPKPPGEGGYGYGAGYDPRGGVSPQSPPPMVQIAEMESPPLPVQMGDSEPRHI